MKQRNQLNVTLKRNVTFSASRERGEKTHGEEVGFELALEEGG